MIKLELKAGEKSEMISLIGIKKIVCNAKDSSYACCSCTNGDNQKYVIHKGNEVKIEIENKGYHNLQFESEKDTVIYYKLQA